MRNIEPLLVFSNCADEPTARNIANALIEADQAACVNVVPGLRSVYKWEGKPCDASEYLLLIKTTSAGFTAVQNTIKTMHPHELPEIIAVPISAGLPAYLDWIMTSVKDSA
jgi:periplasmic divalent cation tolerance protein